MNHLRTLHLSPKVDKKRDLGINLQRFASLTLTEQQHLQESNQSVYPMEGSTDVDECYVNPACDPRFDLNDYEEIMENSKGKLNEQMKAIVKQQKLYKRGITQLIS